MNYFNTEVMLDSETAMWCARDPLTGSLITTKRTPWMAHTRLIQYSVDGELPVVVLDLRTEEGRAGLEKLREYADGEAKFVLQNASYDLPFLKKLGIYPRRLFDTQIASQVLNSGIPMSHSLGELFAHYLNKRPYDEIGAERINAEAQVVRDRCRAYEVAFDQWIKDRNEAEAYYRADTEFPFEDSTMIAWCNLHAVAVPCPDDYQTTEQIDQWVAKTRAARKKELQASDWDLELSDEQMIYAATDVGAEFFELFLLLQDRLKNGSFQKVFDLEMQVLPVISEMSENGLKHNLTLWREYITATSVELLEIEDRIGRYCDAQAQALFPERYMVTLRRNKVKAKKRKTFSRRKKNGFYALAMKRAKKVTGFSLNRKSLRTRTPQLLGELSAIQQRPELAAKYEVGQHLFAMEKGDYRVGSIVRREMGMDAGEPISITSTQQLRELAVETLRAYGVNFNPPMCTPMLTVIMPDTVPPLPIIDTRKLKNPKEIAKARTANKKQHGVEFSWADDNFNEAVIQKVMIPLALRYDADLHTMLTNHDTAQGLRKLVSTYGESYWQWADEFGYIRSSFTQSATDTGRMSSRDPNVQNLPRNMQKMLWCCEEGEVLIKADYSAQEGRLLLFLGKQWDMYQRVLEGMDMHSMSASFLLNKPYDDLVDKVPGKKDKVKPEYDAARTKSKPVTFAPPYGARPKRIAEALGGTLKEGEVFYDNYWKTYDQVRIMQDAQVNSGVELGFVTDLCFGRQRYFVPSAEDLIRMDETGISIEKVREKASAQMMNFACQSVGSTIIKVALIKVFYWIKRNMHTGAKLRLAVHDSLVLTCTKGFEQEVRAAVNDLMEQAASEVVPGIVIPVDVDIIADHTAPHTFSQKAA